MVLRASSVKRRIQFLEPYHAHQRRECRHPAFKALQYNRLNLSAFSTLILFSQFSSKECCGLQLDRHAQYLRLRALTHPVINKVHALYLSAQPSSTLLSISRENSAVTPGPLTWDILLFTFPAL